MCNWNGWQSTSMLKLYSLGARDAHGSQLKRQHMYYLVFVLHASFGALMPCCSLSLQKQLYNRQWEEMPKKYVYPAGNMTWCAPQFRISEGFAVCYRNSMDFIITFLIPRVAFTGSRTVPDTSFHFQSPFNTKLTKESGLYMSLPQVAIHVDILRINVFWYSTG